MRSLEDLYIQAQVDALFKPSEASPYLSVKGICVDIIRVYLEKQATKKISIIIKARHSTVDIVKTIRVDDFKIENEYLDYMVESIYYICENKTYLNLRDCLV